MTMEQTAAAMTMAAAGRSRATTAITTTTIAGASTATTTMMAEASRRLLVGAHQGNADHREEHRDAEEQCTIHTKLLPLNRYRTERDLRNHAVQLCFHPQSRRPAKGGGTFGQCSMYLWPVRRTNRTGTPVEISKTGVTG
jgi:hypothetical protein